MKKIIEFEKTIGEPEIGCQLTLVVPMNGTNKVLLTSPVKHHVVSKNEIWVETQNTFYHHKLQEGETMEKVIIT